MTINKEQEAVSCC